MEAKERIDYLVRLLKFYDYNFHILGKQLVTEDLRDSLRKELCDLEKQFPQYIREDSPNLNIGIVYSNKKIKRTIPMLSLNHTYNIQELYLFIKKILEKSYIILQPKIDGVAVSLVYKTGILDSLSLRGNGYEGEDITHYASYIKNIPLSINYKDPLDIRGEIYLPKAHSISLKRNFVAGALRRKNNFDENMLFYSYDYMVNDNSNKITNLTLDSKLLDFKMCFLEGLNIPTIPYFLSNNFENTINYVNQILNTNYDFEIDGVVLKSPLDMGYSHRYPLNSLAYKFPSESKSTKIKGISWSMNREGKLIPTCEIEPLQINNSIIKFVSAHNYRYLQNSKIGIGTKVLISKVGQTIPQITSVLEPTKPPILENCPFCDSKLILEEINYSCLNKSCKEIIYIKMKFFFQYLNIKGLGEETLRSLFKECLMNNINMDYWNILNTILKKINDKNDLKFQKIKNEFNNFSFMELLGAFGIDGVSEATLKKINNNYSFKENSKKMNNLKVFFKENENQIIKTANILNIKIETNFFNKVF